MTGLISFSRRFTASGDLQRTNKSTIVGGFTGVDVDNRFIYYEQMSLMSPHVFVPLHKTSLTICKKYRFESKSGNTKLVKDFENWGRRINLASKLRTLVRLTCRNGTYVARWEDDKSAPEVMSFEPLMMSKTTIIPEGFNPDKPDTEGDLILTTPIERFIVNEGNSNKKAVKEYKPEDVVYIALYPFDYMQKDIKDRNTYGIYGISLFESITDVFHKYMDVIEGFATYVKKYGQGRYHINYYALEEMLKNGDVQEAIDTLAIMKDEHQTIMANDDIISAGCKITTLDSNGSSLTVTDFKKSLENDIEVGLMQSPITMGKGEGSTYASGYVSESDRLLTLEGLQEEFASMINDQVIKPRALKLGADELLWQDDIYLVFDEISEPNIPLADLINAYIQDIMDYNEVREMIDMKPRDVQPDNGVNPTKVGLQTTMESAKQQGRPEVEGKSNVQKNTEQSQKKVEKKAKSLKV